MTHRRPFRPTMLPSVVVALAVATSCATAPPPTGSEPAATPAPRSYHAWERDVRSRTDALLDEADRLAAAEQREEALRCLYDAIEAAATPPPGYPVRPVYLDFLGELLSEADAVEMALAPPAGEGEGDELMELITEEVAEHDDHAAPQVAALPSSDLPLVWNEQVAGLLDALTRPGEIRSRVAKGLGRSGAYLPMIREHMAEQGLPVDLAWLPLIESAFSNRAHSHASAVGMWQFIAGTGRRYGLDVDAYVDERRDPVQATAAAAAHLRDLHDEFGDWYLALAAYNSGPGNVRRAMRRAGSRDFWEISPYLPRETRSYVPAFIASVMVAKAPEAYGFSPAVEAPWTYEALDVPDACDLSFLADRCDLPLETLRELNPSVVRDLTPPRRTTRLWLPAGASESVRTVLDATPRSEWAPRMMHVVRRGDTLSGIAGRYGSSVEAIRHANSLRGSLIHPGQQLLVPRTSGRQASAAGSTSAPVARRTASSHVVRSRDTLWGISREYGVSLGSLLAANGLSERSTIRPGQRLRIPGGSTTASAGGGETGAYTVRSGDTLYEIARRFGTSVRTLQRLNGLRGSRIHPGDVLRVPQREATG